MEINAQEFWLPKHGSSETEYEDAFSVAKDDFRFAVADGATETSFSGVWAKQLVRAFTSRKLSVPLALQELEPLQGRWETIVRRHPLPWYAEEKARSGAFAAFIGLELLQKQAERDKQMVWRATAVGDSCLIQVRSDEIIVAFPLADSRSFSSRPNLLSSAPASNGNAVELVMNFNGSWGCNDVFFLMTDALACWFLKEREKGNKPWTLLRELDARGQRRFDAFIAGLRDDARIKNDDVTLVRIDVLG